MRGAAMIDTKRYRARILALTIAMAAFGCGDGGQGAAGTGGSAGTGGAGGGGEGGMGGIPGVCTDAPASTPCGDAGELCDGEGQCVTCADGGDCFSDGSDGEFLADQNVELPGGEYDFTSFTIEEGVTVTVTGSEPLIIRTEDGATINGVLTADGTNGANGIGGVGGVAVAGGYDGGNGVFSVEEGPLAGSPGLGPGAGGGGTDWGPGAGASHAVMGGNAALGEAMAGPVYGDAALSTLEGGSGAGGGSGGLNCGGGGGGAGGGIIKLSVLGRLDIGKNGAITANGGNGGTDHDASCGGGGGGSGGTIWLQAGRIANDGLVSAQGGTGVGGGQSNINPVGGYGRIRLDKDTQTGTGAVLPRSSGSSGPWYVPVDAP
jgi:hypothetical protein